MKTQDLKRELCGRLGSFLEYPGDGPRDIARAAEVAVESGSEAAAAFLHGFSAEMDAMEPWMRQEHYVRTFDVMPKCPLYLSVHLFGEESFKRAELMTGLKTVYERHNRFEMTELPDHLALVLKNNEIFEDEEWAELVSMCILPALPKMIRGLEKCGNSYALVLKAVQALLMEREKAHV
ncbi:MAG: molecular chaperone TorD family protein [Candidatus Omnitrophica bacterium]|nr:molecular chaperone TorD family protein [Candidatus Omnitrophota bacterium]